MTRFRSTLWLAVAMAALACGDDGGGAAADAMPETDAAPVIGTCGLQVGTDFGNPIGQTVVFNHPDGTLIGTATIADDGSASRDDCVDGTIVTLVHEDTLYSLYGVNRGVTARWQTFDGFVKPPEVVVTVNDDGDPPTADSFEVRTVCSTEPGVTPGVATDPISPAPLCVDRNPDDIDVVAIALDDTGTPINYSFMSDVAATRPTTTVDMSSAAWSPGAGGGLVELSGFDPDSMQATVLELVDGSVFRRTDAPDPITVTDGEASFITPLLPTDFLERVGLWATRSFFTAGVSTRIQYIAPDAARAMDFTHLLPPVTNGAVSKADPERPTVYWTVDGELDGRGQGTALFLGWREPDGASLNWFLLTSKTTDSSLQLPELPTDLAQRPGPASTFRPALVLLFDFDWLAYDDLLVDGNISPQLLFIPNRPRTLTFTQPSSVPAITETSLSAELATGPMPL